MRKVFERLDREMKSLQTERKPIPGNLAINHRRVSEQLQSHQRVLEARQEERAGIVAQFDADLLRYRELKALRQ